MEAREITDKGSINQKAVLKHRTALVDDMYAVTPPAHVLVSRQPAGAAIPNR
jgi:feruloyl-CoA synthase